MRTQAGGNALGRFNAVICVLSFAIARKEISPGFHCHFRRSTAWLEAWLGTYGGLYIGFATQTRLRLHSRLGWETDLPDIRRSSGCNDNRLTLGKKRKENRESERRARNLVSREAYLWYSILRVLNFQGLSQASDIANAAPKRCSSEIDPEINRRV